MVVRPNSNLKMVLFERGLTQRQLSFATEIDESLISKAIRYGQSTPEMRRSVSDYLGADERELFPWD